MGNGTISSRVKRPVREADYSLLSNAALKISGDLHSFSLICLRGECRENFTFTLHLNCKKSLYQLVMVKVKMSRPRREGLYGNRV